MDDGSRISWLIVILLLLAAMYFAIAETAFASVSRNRLKIGADKGDARAKHALFIKDNFDRAITTILIGTNIVHLAAASIVTVTVTKIWGLSAVTVSTLLTTLAVFFFGEMLPKSIARKYSEKLSLSTASSLRFLMSFFRPLSAVLTGLGNAAASLTKGDPEVSVTEEEIYDIIEDMTEEGTLDEEQGDLISSALQFGEVTVESILTSRVDVAALDVEAPQATVLAFIKGQPHSRIPVYEGTIDHIIGVLQVRKYIKAYLNAVKERKAAQEKGGQRSGKKSSPHIAIRPLLDEPYFVHQSMKIDDLLSIMSEKQINMAVVTDNYGGTLGVVTVEDILEELVGEIWDEDDRAVRNIVLLKDGSYSVNAEEHVMDVLEELDIDLDEEKTEEIGSKLLNELVYENFPEIPKEGDQFDFEGLKITVQSMRNNRIMRVRVEKKDAREENAGNSAPENDDARKGGAV
ncbi:MAG: HlyC/CorC family transporter [Lachnospiraceae bacterium]|nr:HlyC/CorC family transporter [Lachnospiraceae bacterium]